MIAGVLFVWASLGYAGKGDGAVTWLVGKEALLDTEVLIYGGQLLCALRWVFISLKTF